MRRRQRVRIYDVVALQPPAPPLIHAGAHAVEAEDGMRVRENRDLHADLFCHMGVRVIEVEPVGRGVDLHHAAARPRRRAGIGALGPDPARKRLNFRRLRRRRRLGATPARGARCGANTFERRNRIKRLHGKNASRQRRFVTVFRAQSAGLVGWLLCPIMCAYRTEGEAPAFPGLGRDFGLPRPAEASDFWTATTRQAARTTSATAAPRIKNGGSRQGQDRRQRAR